MKGQFMMISAIIAGLITISAASTIATVSQSDFEVDESPKQLYEIRSEASEFDFSKESEREAFEQMVESYGGYEAETSWDGSCLNATVSTNSGEYLFECLEGV